MSDFGIGSWIRKRDRKSTNAIAIVFEGDERSYGTLARRVERVAGALRQRGIVAGDRVAYLGDNHPSFLEAMFGAATVGAIFVPLNTRLAAAEVAYALDDSGSSMLLFANALAETAHAAATAAGVRTLIVVEGAASSDVEEYERVLEGAEPVTEEAEVALTDPAMILYTSGTTGKPKGAVLTHENLTWNAFNVLVDYDLASTDRALMASPLFHVAALGMGTLPAILKGAMVVLERRFDPERVLRLIEKYQITTLSGVPTTFQMLADSPGWAAADLGSLRSLTCGGSPVPLRVIDAYESRGLAFTGGYGMTEASPGVTSLAPGASRAKAGSSGQSHFFTDVRIAAPNEQGVGEIEVRGRNVMAKYWNRPADSSASFSEGSWFRTGDLGFFDDEGYLTVVDRLKDMLISGGENIYPAEVELIIGELAGVSGVAVIGVPDEKWGEVPVAVLTVRPEFSVSESEVRTHLDGRLARYKIPKRVVVVDELPRTASGKILKSTLREQYLHQLNDGK